MLAWARARGATTGCAGNVCGSGSKHLDWRGGSGVAYTEGTESGADARGEHFVFGDDETGNPHHIPTTSE